MDSQIENIGSNSLENLYFLQAQFFENLQVKGRSTNTLKNYKTDLECFNTYVRDISNVKTIEKFSIPEIVEYGKYLESRYNSDNSRRRRVQALRLFFDFLVERGVFNHNPVRKVPTSPKFLDIPRPAPFSHVKTLWYHLSQQEKEASNELEKVTAMRNQIIFLLIYTGGLKVSDLATLKRAHFSLGKSNRVMIMHPKRDPYSVNLPDFFITIFEKFTQACDKLKEKHSLEYDEILFNANAHRILSGGLSPRGIELLFKSWRKMLVMEITPKSLRQSCIFTWLQKGINENVIKEWLGVSPSYSLKLYKEHLSSHPFSDSFLEVTYRSFND